MRAISPRDSERFAQHAKILEARVAQTRWDRRRMIEHPQVAMSTSVSDLNTTRSLFDEWAEETVITGGKRTKNEMYDVQNVESHASAVCMSCASLAIPPSMLASSAVVLTLATKAMARSYKLMIALGSFSSSGFCRFRRSSAGGLLILRCSALM